MSYIQIAGGTGAGGGIAASLLGNNTSGALALVSTGTLRLAGGNNITLSQNGQSVTISAANSNPGSISMSELWPLNVPSLIQSVALSQSSLVFYPMPVPANLACSQVMNLYSMSISTSSNSSFAGVFSQSVGIYTLTGNTLNLITASSGSTNFQFSNTSNNSTLSFNNVRAFVCPLPFSASPGNYYVGNLWVTSTTNANWFTLFPLQQSVTNIAVSGTFAVATNASQAFIKGAGVYTAQTNALPASVNIAADISSGSSLVALRAPYMQFQGF